MRVAAVALGAVALVMVTATACDDGPECLDSHTVTNFVPVYNATTKTTTVQPVITVVCDRYETGESK
jgi:hypothetical protein